MNEECDQAQDVRRWFESLEPIDQEELGRQLGNRAEKWRSQILPRNDEINIPQIVNTKEAERAVLLLSYYSMLTLLLCGVTSDSYAQKRIELSTKTNGFIPEREIKLAKERASDFQKFKDVHNAFLAEIDEGNWILLKQYCYSKMREYIMHPIERSMYDFSRFARVMGLVPDHTQPIDPVSIDPDPPLIIVPDIKNVGINSDPLNSNFEHSEETNVVSNSEYILRHIPFMKGDTVIVQRSDGNFEDDWFIHSFDGHSGVAIVQKTSAGETFEKRIPRSVLEELNPGR